MLPSSPSPRSVSVVPQHSPDVAPRSLYLDWPSEGSGETDVRTRLVDDESLDKADDGTGYSKADAAIMKEVAAWLKLRRHDEFWASRSSYTGKIVPTASELLTRLREPAASPPNTLDHAERFDALIQAIALQLLASCYTFLPIPSANHIPLFQQKTGSKLVTALRAHSPYRFSPAAGHHARASSETTPWPDQYFGPSLEDTNQLRRSAKRSSEYTPHFAASGWADGPNDAEHHRSGTRSRKRSSPCGVDILTRLCYRSSSPTNSPRRHSLLFTRNICIGNREGQPSDNQDRSGKNRVLETDSRTLQHYSLERPHHIQSRPSIRREERPVFDSSRELTRRTSSRSSFSSTPKQTSTIPEIRRMSATPSAVHKVEDCMTAHSNSKHKCLDEAQITQPPTFSHLNKPPPMLSQTADISPFSDPKEQKKTDEGYFNMPNANTPQPNGNNQGHRHTTADHHHDTTEPDHTGDTDDIQDDHDNPTIYPPPATRIHPRLARDNSGMYDDDTGPDPASDPRLRKLMARQESNESGSEGESEMERDQRRGSIEGVEEVVVERARVLAREMDSGDGCTGGK